MFFCRSFGTKAALLDTEQHERHLVTILIGSG
jgi:hypothetical protein